MYIFSIVLIVASNVLYHVCQKSTPGKVNPFAALLVTYLTAAFFAALAFFFSKPGTSLVQSLKELNWTSITLGFAILGLELGTLIAYRAGWNISMCSLVASIFLALALIPIGLFFYQEGFDLYKAGGAIFCIIGLVLINK